MLHTNRSVLFIYFLIILLCVHCENESAIEKNRDRLCRAFLTCNSCVQGSQGCSWCYQENFKGDRCRPKKFLEEGKCLDIFTDTESSRIVTIISDKNFHDVTNPDVVEESVQIKPQRIVIKLHQQDPLKVTFKYRPAKNYPLDLYYLMDLTLTMEPDVATMANLGKELTELLKNLTEHFRVAFGYYSDKVAMPFSKMTPGFLENPCVNDDRKCRKAFDFIHALNFTNDVDQFITKVNASKTTANLDNLEGGFDALYQIILCENYIKWRKDSRRIIVIATDGMLHLAGDGILAGAVRRNDHRCLLDANGIYKPSLIYDYPSLEEVYHRLLHHKMFALFAAKQDAINYYKSLNELIPDRSYVGLLSEESRNVLELVRDGYRDVLQHVKFSVNASENLKVSFRAKCNGAWNKTSECRNVEEGKEYTFEATLDLKNFPEDVQHEIVIIEEKTINERLIIEVEYVGKCNCSVKGDQLCANGGIYKCGVCECKEGWKGVKCDESCFDYQYTECRETNETYTSSTCYGRGDCQCGKCICDEEYTGKFCSERQCPKNKEGQVCSGRLHGICRDGKCECTQTYKGNDCSCTKSTANCVAPGSTKICSNKGSCNCGSCNCEKDYSGNYCEICPTCTGLCVTYEDCVLDYLLNDTTSANCFTDDGTNFTPNRVNYTATDEDITICSLRYDNKDARTCNAQFKYTTNKDFTVALDIFYNECSEPLRAGTLIGIIIGAIVGIGIMAIVIVKGKLMNDDRLEYARFQENVKANKELEENPLYNSPIRTYQMPTELQHRIGQTST